MLLASLLTKCFFRWRIFFLRFASFVFFLSISSFMTHLFIDQLQLGKDPDCPNQLFQEQKSLEPLLKLQLVKDLVCSSKMIQDPNLVDPSLKIQVPKDLQLIPMKSRRGDHESLETLFLESQTLATTSSACVSIASGRVPNPEPPLRVLIPAVVSHVLPITQLASVVPLQTFTEELAEYYRRNYDIQFRKREGMCCFRFYVFVLFHHFMLLYYCM